MKNRIVTLLTVTILTGSLLVGCGGNETETGASKDSGVSISTESNVETEANENTEELNSDNEASEVKYGVSNPDAAYTETEYCYIVSDASFVEEKYNDGTEFDRTNWTPVNEVIKLNAPISIYNPFKDIMGYMKTDVTIVYVSVDGEWSYLGFAGEVAKDGLYPNGGTYVRTDELKVVMEEVDNSGSMDNEDSEDSYVAEDIAKIKEAIEAAGLIYDESAFEGEDLASYPNLIAYTDGLSKSGATADQDVYGYLLNNLPIGMNDEQIIPAFTEFMKPYAGKSFIIEVVSDEGRNYDFNVYIK